VYQVKYFRIHFLETFGLSLVGYHLITISGCCNEISNAKGIIIAETPAEAASPNVAGMHPVLDLVYRSCG